MAKRDNNYSKTSERPDYVITGNIEEALEYLEKQGKLKPKMTLQHKYINDRCIQLYSTIIDINKKIKELDKLDKPENKDTIALLKLQKSDYQTSVINLSSIVIGSVIKKFKTLYPAYYNDVFTSCVLDILQKINNDKYDQEKSAFHSYMYETSYQACIKYLDDKAKYENSTVSLIQD